MHIVRKEFKIRGSILIVSLKSGKVTTVLTKKKGGTLNF